MNDPPDRAILRARELFAQSGLTLDQLGQRMGHDEAVARKVAWQLLNKVADPRLSTLRKFAAAVKVSLAELFADEKKSRSK
jgi:transcriptional regulator with XRE-family HTH domain